MHRTWIRVVATNIPQPRSCRARICAARERHTARAGGFVRAAMVWGVAVCGGLLGQLAAAQAPAAPAGPPPEVKVVATRLGGNVYGIDGQGGRMAALVGPDGVFLVDSQFAPATARIVAALKEI